MYWFAPDMIESENLQPKTVITTEFTTAHVFEAVGLMSAFNTDNRTTRETINKVFNLAINSINGVVRDGANYAVRLNSVTAQK